MKINTTYPENPKGDNKFKNFSFFLARIIIASVIIFWLISNHYNDFIKAIKQIDIFWLFLALIFNILIYLASAIRWYFLLKLQQLNVSFFETISLTMQGLFFSVVIPGGAIGGDIIKTGFLLSKISKGNKIKATSTIFMDRFIGMLGQFPLAIIMCVICWPLIINMDKYLRFTIFTIIFVCILGILAGITLFLHRKFERIKIFAWLLRKLDKLTKGFISQAIQVFDIYRRSYSTIIKCFSVQLIFIHLNAGFILYLISKGVDAVNISLPPLLLSISLGNIAGLLPITPSGIGTRDAIIKEILSSAGYFEGNALAIPLIFSAILVIISIFSGIFFIFKRDSNHNSNRR